MDKFFEIVSKWNMLGQGIFFLLLFLMLCSCIQYVFYYIAVACKGWPGPDDKTVPDETSEED